jgi:Xaa-Pro aminopeptidase
LHDTEYTPDAYKRRAYLTGFQGSAGTAVVTSTQALLWTDSRYWNEASLQLDTNHWILQKAGQTGVPTITTWLADLAKAKYTSNNKQEISNNDGGIGSISPLRVGIDPFVHAASFAKEMEDAFAAAAKDISFNDDDDNDDDKATRKLLNIGTLDTSSSAPEGNLIDAIWQSDTNSPRPALPASPFRVHPMEYAGWSVETKVEKIRKEMREGEKTKGATLAVFCTLDDVAYLLNMRAKGDVDTYVFVLCRVWYAKFVSCGCCLHAKAHLSVLFDYCWL